MNQRIRRELAELREGARILTSRNFWRAFHRYWSPDAISGRMDEWASRRRQATGKEPDWVLERRIARRRAKQNHEGPAA